jgi:hypothetical protein
LCCPCHLVCASSSRGIGAGGIVICFV